MYPLDLVHEYRNYRNQYVCYLRPQPSYYGHFYNIHRASKSFSTFFIFMLYILVNLLLIILFLGGHMQTLCKQVYRYLDLCNEETLKTNIAYDLYIVIPVISFCWCFHTKPSGKHFIFLHWKNLKYVCSTVAYYKHLIVLASNFFQNPPISR